MGKFDDLDESTIDHSTSDTPIDAFRFVQQLRAMRLDRMYDFAADTIDGILETVQTSGHVTVGQDRAIQNIRVGAQRNADSRDTRRPKGRWRHDGFGGRNR